MARDAGRLAAAIDPVAAGVAELVAGRDRRVAARAGDGGELRRALAAEPSAGPVPEPTVRALDDGSRWGGQARVGGFHSVRCHWPVSIRAGRRTRGAEG